MLRCIKVRPRRPSTLALARLACLPDSAGLLHVIFSQFLAYYSSLTLMLGKAWPNKILDPSEGSLVPAYCSNNCGLGDLVRRIREYAVLSRGTLTFYVVILHRVRPSLLMVLWYFHAVENREMHRNTKEITLHACRCCVHLISTIPRYWEDDLLSPGIYNASEMVRLLLFLYLPILGRHIST